MNCLPIVSRELRVAARKRSTFWLRVAAAATGLVIGSGCLLLSTWQGTSTTQMGSALFAILTWLCLAAGLSAGLFFTSDCLSEEKREGTLGLLFLTELRGYDVTLGKLAATSLRGFYALLAVLPIVAITQLMGGITGAQYWKSALALVNGLFFSLAAGMLISALSRDSQKALAGTLFLLLLLTLGGVAADGIIAGVSKRAFKPVWSLASPGYVLVSASAWGRSAYWNALLVTQVLAWAMLAVACMVVPHAWQERKKAGRGSTGQLYAWKYGGAGRRQRLRRKLLERWPMAWLACRERWQSRGLWALAVLMVGGFVTLLIRQDAKAAWIAWNYLGGLFVLILYLWAASQACRFLVEARRSGLLELLLATPVSEKQMIAGQWRALLSMFALPVLLLLGVQAGAATLSQLSFQRIAAQVNSSVAAVSTNQTSGASTPTVVTSGPVVVSVSGGSNSTAAQRALRLSSSAQQIGMAAAAATATALSTLGNLLALCWFGMWMGMTSKSANLATLKTILFVQLIPWFIIAFGTSVVLGLVMSRLFTRAGTVQPGTWFLYWPLSSAVLSATLALAKDLGFILWSRKKLRLSLREQAGQNVGESRFAAPPPLPPILAAPPVVAVPQ